SLAQAQPCPARHLVGGDWAYDIAASDLPGGPYQLRIVGTGLVEFEGPSFFRTLLPVIEREAIAQPFAITASFDAPTATFHDAAPLVINRHSFRDGWDTLTVAKFGAGSFLLTVRFFADSGAFLAFSDSCASPPAAIQDFDDEYLLAAPTPTVSVWPIDSRYQGVEVEHLLEKIARPDDSISQAIANLTARVTALERGQPVVLPTPAATPSAPIPTNQPQLE